MTKELLLIRHAEAFANVGDFAAMGNYGSPLTEKGRLEQCPDLRTRIHNQFGFFPEEYESVVVGSEYRRPRETALYTGFRRIDVNPLLNEPDFSTGIMTGKEIVAKHQKERWAPEEARIQARRLIECILNDDFPYFIAFTHGMFTATVLLELETSGHDMSGYTFDEKRGYVPLQTGVTKLIL
jgi:broad specificity phosphatase PhoE